MIVLSFRYDLNFDELVFSYSSSNKQHLNVKEHMSFIVWYMHVRSSFTGKFTH
jgi:hypothetical protein